MPGEQASGVAQSEVGVGRGRGGLWSISGRKSPRVADPGRVVVDFRTKVAQGRRPRGGCGTGANIGPPPGPLAQDETPCPHLRVVPCGRTIRPRNRRVRVFPLRRPRGRRSRCSAVATPPWPSGSPQWEAPAMDGSCSRRDAAASRAGGPRRHGPHRTVEHRARVRPPAATPPAPRPPLDPLPRRRGKPGRRGDHGPRLSPPPPPRSRPAPAG
jgi:hypothetical protein